MECAVHGPLVPAMCVYVIKKRLLGVRMNRIMIGLDKILALFERYLGITCFLLMLLVCVAQVLLRTFSLPLFWTEELARYLFAWTIYLGCSLSLLRGSHYSIDILPYLLKGRKKAALLILVQLICVAGSILLLYLCVQLLGNMIAKPSYSPAARINMLFPYGAPAMGMILMSLRGIYNIWKIIADYKEEKAFGGGRV